MVVASAQKGLIRMKISPCIDTVYRGYPLETALAEIKGLGYAGFEFWHIAGRDIAEMCRLKDKYGLEAVNLNAPEASLTDAGQRPQFLEGLKAAAAAAKELGCGRVAVLPGNDTGKSRAQQRKNIVDALAEAAPIAEEAGVTLVLEAANRRVNRPNNFLTSADEAFEILDRVGSPRVKMLYDIYHQQITEGDLLARMLPNMDKIGHFHAAGVPGRHELDECEINYGYLLGQIERAGYDGWVGLEYFPARAPAEGLRKLAAYLA